MLILDAELEGGRRRADLRLAAGRIVEIGTGLRPQRGEAVIEARGDALLPALHDAHLHLLATAAARESVDCGPRACPTQAALAQALRAADARLPAGRWLRGVGWHDGHSGDLDRARLDAWLPLRPLRIQHRSGRLWWLNSAALRALGVVESGGDDPCERIGGRCTGRVFDADDWLRDRLPRQLPDMAPLSEQLWRWGVTSVTDTGQGNGIASAEALAQMRETGVLRQHLRLMGTAELEGWQPRAGIEVGEYKLHLHDHDLPDFDAFCVDLRRRRAAGRGLAFHCVSRVDLTYALAALDEVGARPGDRIEHASVTPPELLDSIRRQGLTVVTQPALIAERGDDYLREVAPEDRPWLYRLEGFRTAGVPLAGSSDAPYTEPNPWRAMAAAVSRRTASGRVVGAGEALTAEAALALYLGTPEAPAVPRRIAPGVGADLMLLDRPWAEAARDLSDVCPRWVHAGI